MKDAEYVIGVDYGTDSVRSVLVNAHTGEEIASSVFEYPRWKKGLFCDPPQNQFRQHPLDYIEGLTKTIQAIVSKSPKSVVQAIRGISIDTTGSTPVAVDQNGTPLALLPEFAKNPNAMFILWKDHTAVEEAKEINELAKNWGGDDFTKYEGGVYSSEWFWSKILHVIRNDKKVAKAAYSWVEHCDWIPALLTGNTDPVSIKRSRCAAGHKAMWHPSWNGLPPKEFLSKLDPRLAELRDRLYTETFTSDVPVGQISKEWAKRLGLPDSVVVGVGAFDAHMGAVGAEITPYQLVKIMGTSTCDMVVVPLEKFNNKLIQGICGQVEGSIIPGMLGLEAGQSSFGDVYAWFKEVLAWPLRTLGKRMGSASSIEKSIDQIIPELSRQAEKIPPGASEIVALDWLNGRRTPFADQRLKGALMGLTLGSDAPRIFRALVEATAFGARAINDQFIKEGVPIQGIIAIGGVSKKSPFVMQIVSDVLGMKIRVVRSEQACALGAAMFAATVAGIYPTVEKAQKAMGSGFEKEYKPRKENSKIYLKLYEKYKRLGAFVESEISK